MPAKARRKSRLVGIAVCRTPIKGRTTKPAMTIPTPMTKLPPLLNQDYGQNDIKCVSQTRKETQIRPAGVMDN